MGHHGRSLHSSFAANSSSFFTRLARRSRSLIKRLKPSASLVLPTIWLFSLVTPPLFLTHVSSVKVGRVRIRGRFEANSGPGSRASSDEASRRWDSGGPRESPARGPSGPTRIRLETRNQRLWQNTLAAETSAAGGNGLLQAGRRQQPNQQGTFPRIPESNSGKPVRASITLCVFGEPSEISARQLAESAVRQKRRGIGA